MKHNKRVFTWAEWVAAAEAVETDEGKAMRTDHLSYASHKSKDEYDGTFNDVEFDEAVRMAHEGWSSSVVDVDRTARKISDEIFTERFATIKRQKLDTFGSRVSVPRFLAGEPKNMRRTVKRQISRHGRAVRVVVPAAFHCGVTVETTHKRGAAVMALVHSLITAGHPMEIWVQLGIRAGGDYTSYAVLVQRADKPLNMGRVMYACAHPSMLRRLCFAVMEQEPAAMQDQFGYGYGSPSKAREEDLPSWRDAGNSIILPQLEGNGGWSEPECKAWVEAQLDRILT